MKPAKKTTKKAAVVKPKTDLNPNLDYVQEICDEAIATIMALNALIRSMANEKEAKK